MRIQVIYELDESKNQRIIIIRGEEDTNRLNIITSENKDESYYHGYYLKKYFDQEYLYDITMQGIKDKIDGNFYMTKSIIYFLANKYKNIIFTETTKDFSTERTGIFFVPDVISDFQFLEIQKLMPYFKNFETILLQDNLTNENIFDESTYIFKDEKIAEIEEYFKMRVKKKRI